MYIPPHTPFVGKNQGSTQEFLQILFDVFMQNIWVKWILIICAVYGLICVIIILLSLIGYFIHR